MSIETLVRVVKLLLAGLGILVVCLLAALLYSFKKETREITNPAEYRRVLDEDWTARRELLAHFPRERIAALLAAWR